MLPAALARSRHVPATLPRTPAPALAAVGRWQLARVVAATEHAELYQARPAHHPVNSPADYLVKVARDDSQELGVALLRREKFVAAGIRHPHLTAVLDGDLSHAPPYLVLGSAGSAAVDRKRLPIRSALWRTRQAAAAVAALHAVGWIHTRLTPQALLVAPRGHVTLSELGWARRIGSDECRGEHVLAADLRYVAPEMLCDGTLLTPACDVYALGLLLIELFIGRPAVNAELGWQAGLAHLRGELADVRALCPEVPQSLVELLHQMTCREPLRRPEAHQVERRLVRLELAQLSGERTCRTRWR